MEFDTFLRKPFVVEAIEITEDNIEEISALVGALRTKADGTPYIQVNHRLVPNVFRVFPGFWMTRMGDNIHCYSRKVFEEQFVTIDDDILNWVEYINRKQEPSGEVEAHITDAIEDHIDGVSEFEPIKLTED